MVGQDKQSLHHLGLAIEKKPFYSVINSSGPFSFGDQIGSIIFEEEDEHASGRHSIERA